MSNLSNLFISQSFFGIINLENSLEPLTSASGDVELQDGAGDNLGLKINAQTKEFTIVNNLRVDGNADFNGNVDFSGSLTHTGSLDVLGDITASGNIKATIGNFDTVNTRVLHVTQESASVIFSSGSNVLGDEETDRQDLIGQVIVSGTLGLEGNASFTGSLTVSNEISSSTLNGVGNVTIYSASVDNRLDSLETDTGSQDGRLDNLEAFTSSQENINGGYNSFTSSYFIDSASFDSRLDQQEAFSSSLVTDFVTDAQFNPYTASVEAEQLVQDGRLNNLELETSSIDNRLNTISAATSSYVSTATNNTFSGSINATVNAITLASSTASLDCSLGNFYTVTLNAGSNKLVTTNRQSGQTLTLKVKQPSSGYGELSASAEIKFPEDFPYLPTNTTNAEDIITLVTYDTTSLYAVAVNKLV